MSTSAAPVWEVFADVLLHREAALCRLGSGVPPRDFAGLYVADQDLDRLLQSLPGLDGPPPESAEPVRQAFAEPLTRARAELQHWLSDSDQPLAQAARRAGLAVADRQVDVEVLALIAAIELNPQRQRIVAYLQDSVNLPRLTLATVRRLFGPGLEADRALAEGAPLRRAGLVALEDTGPWAIRMCSLPPRVAWAIRGDRSPDTGLPAEARLIDPPEAPGSAGPAGAENAAGLPAGARLLLVHGADPESRRQLVRRAFPRQPLLSTPAPTAEAGWAAVLRESCLTGAAVLLETDGGLDALARRTIERSDQLAWVISSRIELPLESLPEVPWTECRVDDGTADTADWMARLGVAETGLRLNREQLRLVAAAAGGDPGRLDGAVRRLAGGHLEGLAMRVRPSRCWSDLVLPNDQRRQLAELVARHRLRQTVFTVWGFAPVPSSGVVALFAGPSGTGKTLAAEVIAGDLGLDLYKIDLSAVVSKYIGETEKNLERIFESASAGDMVLFFDEADSLFGKRSEVSDAHDRYANIEVAYLLQRLESYDGLVVLATNLQKNIDQAFLRRISVAVEFSMPDESERRAIWALGFPPGAPVDDLDLDFLARQFKVPGGVIRNAALGAAFLAAAERGPISMERIALSMKREFQKLGRLRTETEFDRYFELVSRDGVLP